MKLFAAVAMKLDYIFLCYVFGLRVQFACTRVTTIRRTNGMGSSVFAFVVRLQFSKQHYHHVCIFFFNAYTFCNVMHEPSITEILDACGVKYMWIVAQRKRKQKHCQVKDERDIHFRSAELSPIAHIATCKIVLIVYT